MNVTQNIDSRARARDMLRRHAARATPVPRSTSSINPQDLADSIRFETFPGYVEYRRQREIFSRFSVRNPYFSIHDGVQGGSVCVDGQEYASFSSYNYLDLVNHPAVIEASIAAVRRFGTTVSASRVVSGEIPLHRQLERDIAQFIGFEDAVVFVSGYATNVSTIGHLFGTGDLILHDSLIHNSIVTGAKLSGARRMPFPHNDYDALERILADNRKQYRRAVIITEGVFSMDGDVADLPRLVDIKQRHQTLLMVDEAHSLGVLGARGAGIAEHFDLPAGVIDIWMGTLSKSLASCGGVIAGNNALIENLRFNAPGGILYSVGLSPANTAAAIAALAVLRAEPERVERLLRNSRHFLACARRYGLDTGTAEGTPVVPVVLGNSLACLQVSDRLFQQGIQVHPILYPAVPEEASRLRFFITRGMTRPASTKPLRQPRKPSLAPAGQ
jgi:8-amino-7-oxononanoate synthase